METSLRDSNRLCRLCGEEDSDSETIFDHPEDSSLCQSLNFFLPIEVRFIIFIGQYNNQSQNKKNNLTGLELGR